VTDARYTYTAGMPAARVGWLVARARSIAGITDRDLAAIVGVSERAVRRWERGDLVPTDDEVEAIAAACGTRLTELLPRRVPVSYDRATGIMRMGDHAIAIPGSMHDNDAVLGAYIGMVRRQRGLRPDQEVRVREEDLEALSEALDLDDDELEDRLVRVIGLSRTQAAAVRAHLLRRRLAVPMVGLLAAFALLGVNRIVSTATEEVRTVGGGSVTRGNPYLVPTTTTTTPQSIVYLPTSAIPAPPASAATEPPTLPPVVTAEPAAPATQGDVRTGPPRTNRSRTTVPSTDATDATNPPSSEAPVTSPPVTSPATTSSPTTPPATAGPTPPPATVASTSPPPTSRPVVPTLPPGGVTGTTELPPPTTTTTKVPPSTTAPPASTTTTPPTTTNTLGGNNGSTLSGDGSSGTGTSGTGSGTGTGTT
jgi:transcriptional regulator with XRE-family HTH domain